MSALADRTVLVLEDEPLVAMMAVDMLEQLGARVAGPAGTLEEAREVAGSQALDAALIDLNIAGTLSVDFLDELVARGLPVVVATGYGAANEALAGRDLPVVGKPYTLDKLDAAFQKALAG